jgi:hypothetical protein
MTDRRIARDQVAEAGRVLKRHSLATLRPLCSSKDEPIDNCAIAEAVFFYAEGLMGDAGDAQALAVKIERLHIHYDKLYVLVTADLNPEETDNLQQAWAEVAGEQREGVHVTQDGPLWQDIWKQRRAILAPQQGG